MTEQLREAKAALTAQRKASKAQARNLELELNLPAEHALDEAVRDAFLSNLSRAEIARAIGESRVTVNERINRAFRGNVPVIAVSHIQPEPPPEVGDEPKVATYALEANSLLVHYVGYGPDSITGTGRFEIITDDEGATYWFLAEDREATPVDLLSALDTVFEGWYYEDAVGYVGNQLELQDSN